MTLTHLSPDELDVWNQLDKAVALLLKDRTRNDPLLGNMDARAAAKLRDKIGSQTTSASYREQYVQEAKRALETDEWWHSSVNGSGGGDE